jgi:lipid-binding SYLF domain-containing protein
MKRIPTLIGVSLMMCTQTAAPLHAQERELTTLRAAGETVDALGTVSLKGIPPALMANAKGVAIIPRVIKAGFLIGGRFGRGVVMARQPNGDWSNPVFISLAGGSVGWQAGVQSTDVLLVFKTQDSLKRILEGKDKVTLGADVAVAAGPVGRQAGASTDGELKAEIYSYSRSRGLFAGVSLEGAGLLVDGEANSAFYSLRSGRPADVLALPGSEALEVRALKDRLMRLAAPTVIVVPPGTVVAPAPAPPIYVPAPAAPPLAPPH